MTETSSQNTEKNLAPAVRAQKTTKNFQWTGRTKSMQTVSGQTRAISIKDLRLSLKKQGVTVSSMKEVKGVSGRITHADIISFTQQLSTMLKSGIAIIQALDIIMSSVIKESMSNMITDLKENIRQGHSFADSLRKYPDLFDNLFVNLVAAGEKSGSLDELLERIVKYMEVSSGTKKKVKSALTYPLILLTVAVCVVTLLLVWVVPTFQDIFGNLGTPLPAITRFIIAASAVIQKIWLPTIIIISTSIYLFMRKHKNSREFRKSMKVRMLSWPLIGPLLRVSTIGRFTQTMVTMLHAGVPILEGLDYSAKATNNELFEDLIEEARENIKKGMPINLALQITKFFPQLVIQMVVIGEESGQLESMLQKVSYIYERQLEDAVRALSSAIEPIIIVIVGGVIAFVVVAMYMPIFSMGNAV